MVDNTILNAGAGGDTIRDLARGGGTVKTQVVALDLGGPSQNAENLVTAGQQTSANSIPVVIASDGLAEPGGSAVTGAPLPSGGSGLTGWLSAIWKTLQTGLGRAWTLSSSTDSVDVGNFPASQTISGSVSVSNLPATQAVSAGSLPLPANAARETGGNLAAAAAALAASQSYDTPSCAVLTGDPEGDFAGVSLIETLMDPASGEAANVCVGNLPLPIVYAGTTGIDHSANPPATPNVGNNFGASGPYANYVLITTIPTNPTRHNIDIENASGSQIVVVRDNGITPWGLPPLNATLFPLSGTTAYSQGGAWSSQTFKGRLQIYAPSSTAFVPVMED